MFDDEIERLRKKIDKLMVSEETDKGELLETSQELDILIVEYLKKQKKNDL